MLLSDLERAAEVCRASLGFPGISVYAADGLGLAELVMATPLAHSQVRLSRAGRLRAAGFALEPTRSWPHYTLRLTDASPAELHRVEQAFSPTRAEPSPPPMTKHVATVVAMAELPAVWVDFNDVDEAGGVVTLRRSLAPASEVAVGQRFLAGDDEGNTCPAKVAWIAEDGRVGLELDLSGFVPAGEPTAVSG